MNDIRIYDYEFQLLHIEPQIKSAYWILRYNDVGTFQGTFPLSSGIVDIVLKNRYLILVQGELQALISAYSVDKDKLTVFGKTVNWILTKKTIGAFDADKDWKTENIIPNLNPGTVANYIVKSAFQKVDDFIVSDFDVVESSLNLQRTERADIETVIKEYLDLHELGHRVRLDIPNKKWIFEVYQGAVQDTVLSEQNRNLYDVTISDDAQQFYCSAWYKREWEDLGTWEVGDNNTSKPPKYAQYYKIKNVPKDSDEELRPTTFSYPNGSYYANADTSSLSKYADVYSELPVLEEKAISNKDFSGLYDWETSLSGKTEQEVLDQLGQKKWTHKIDGKVRNMVFGSDFGLGDVFRVQVQIGSYFEESQKAISDVDIWWEPGNVGVKIKFKEEK